MKALLGLDLPTLDSSALERPPQAAAASSLEKTVAYHSKCEVCYEGYESNEF